VRNTGESKEKEVKEPVTDNIWTQDILEDIRRLRWRVRLLIAVELIVIAVIGILLFYYG